MDHEIEDPKYMESMRRINKRFLEMREKIEAIPVDIPQDIKHPASANKTPEK